MNDYGMSRAQASYDAQEPAEGNSRCECGHDFDDHNEHAPYDDVTATVNDLREIDALRPLDILDHVKIINILDRALTVCQAKDCTCRKFSPREDYDGPED